MFATEPKKAPYRVYLSEEQIPTSWYNLRANMPTKPGRMLLPDGTPAQVEHIAPVFAEELCKAGLYLDNVREVDIKNVTVSGVVGEGLILNHVYTVNTENFEVK